MILSENILVDINPSNISHYLKFYPEIKNKDKIHVDINHLTSFSKAIIEVKCDNCGIEKELMWKNYKSYGYANGEYFCKSCKLKKNNLEKWGVENVFQLDSIKNKSKKTNLEKWGVEFISQSKEIKKIIKEKNLEKWGVDHHFKDSDNLSKMKENVKKKYNVENVSQLPEIQEKKKETSLKNNGFEYIFQDMDFKKKLIEKNREKWGFDYYFQSEIGKSKIKETNNKKWGFEILSKNDSIKNKIKKSVTEKLHDKIFNSNKNIKDIDSERRIFSILCEDCGEVFQIGYFLYYKRRETGTQICTICNEIDKHQSGLENLLRGFIKKNYEGLILDNWKISGKELDIYLPESNIAFEFNGLYWHSEIFKDRNYHKVKSDLCDEMGIHLIHVWEDDWLYRGDIVKSMILNKLKKSSGKIFARKCKIMEINNNSLVRDFLNKNHIQGYVASTIKLGLFHDEKLVSLMCFKKNSGKWELNRFCSLLNHNVIGASSKLFKYFTSNYSGDIYTFSDRTYSNGSIYQKLNFQKIMELAPDYKIVQNGIRIHKFNFRNKDVGDCFRIYDAGKLKWNFKS